MRAVMAAWKSVCSVRMRFLGLLVLLCVYADPASAQCAASLRLNEPLSGGRDVQFEQFFLTPDGGRVIYRADQETDEVFEIFSVPSDRSSPPVKLNDTLPSGGDVSQQFVLTADGSNVVYVADQDTNNRNELYIVPATGGVPTKLNGTVSSGVGNFTVSPDGSRVAYIADEDTAGHFELFSVATTGGPSVKLHGDPPGTHGSFYKPLITPDSSRVVFGGFLDAYPVLEMYSTPITGGIPIKLSGPMTSGGSVVADAYRLSPDGSNVVYIADQDTNDVTELYIAPVAESNVYAKLNPPLVTGGNVNPYENLLFSPDGQWVLYMADQETAGLQEFFAVAPTGGPAYKLNNALSGSSPGAQEIQATPDSSRAVFTVRDASTYKLFSALLNGTSNAAVELNDPLPALGSVFNGFAITPDSSMVVFKADQITNDIYEIFKVPVGGGSSPVKLNGFLAGDRDVNGFRLSPDGSVVLYNADQDLNDVFDLYRVPLSLTSAPKKVNSTLVSGGDVATENAFFMTPDNTRVIYLADQVSNEVYELFTAFELSDADLSIGKLDSPDPVNAEQLITYSIVVSNLAACDVSDVVVTDPVPAGTILFDVSGGCALSNGVVTCEAPVLPGLSTTTFTIRVIAATNVVGGELTNVASVTSAVTDPDASNNTVTQTTAVVAPLEFCLDGFKLSQTLIAAGDVTEFTISPDGRRAVFQADPDSDNRFRIYSVPLDGSGVPILISEVALQPGAGGACCPVVSADSQWVVYHGEVDGSYTEHVFARPIDGSAPSVQLSSNVYAGSRALDGVTVVSPDSTRVVYIGDYDPNEGLTAYQLFSAPIDGSGPQTNLNGSLATGGDVQGGFNGPVVTPDSARVVYRADRDVNDKFELYSVAITGGVPVKLNSSTMSNNRDVVDFDLSPDGQRVVYLADERVDGINELFSVPTAGGVSTQLNANFDGNADLFSDNFLITPDSSRVLFRVDQPVNSAWQLYSVPIDGSAAAVILNGPLPSGGYIGKFQSTHDSLNAVYVGLQDTANTYELYTVDIYGSNDPIKLSAPMATGGIVYAFAITPDDSRVVYRAAPAVLQPYELYSVPLDTSSPAAKISGTLVAGGSVGHPDNLLQFAAFQITPDGERVVYIADQIVDENYELFSVPVDGSLPPVRLHPASVTGGDVDNESTSGHHSPFLITSDSRLVAYTADHEMDDQVELFVSDVEGAKVDLTIDKSDLADPVVAGLGVSYIFSITNNSICDARNVTLTDLLPPGVTPLGPLVTNIGTVAAGSSISVTITLNVASSSLGLMTNEASVSSDATDTNTANDADSEVTTVIAEADLDVKKADSPDPIVDSTLLTYTVTVTNFGPSDAHNVQVTDVLPAGVTPGGLVNSNLGTLAAGVSTSFTIEVNVDSNSVGVLTNQATVTADTTDNNVTNNTDQETTTIQDLDGDNQPDFVDTDDDDDGMPDDYENGNGLDPKNAADAGSDDDMDGATAFEEYVADTDPNNSNDVFAATEAVNVPTPEIHFISRTGRYYSLHYSTGLLTGAWLPIPGQTNVPGTGGPQSLADTNDVDASRDYRLGVQIAP